jgi:hypothetical protein
MDCLFRRPKEFREIIELIGVTPSGQRLIANFSIYIQKVKVEFKSYPDELRAKLHASIFDSSFTSVSTTSSDSASPLGLRPLGAAFVTDGTSGIIYFDLQETLGVLAPLIYHELVHCLDETLWKAAVHRSTPSQLRELIFLAECRAYAAQYEFQEQLKEKYPMLDKLYSLYVDSFPALSRRLEPFEIAELYTASR